MMEISVIIPSYKPQSYLWECLGSLQKQTFPKKDFEILLILNGCYEPYKSQIEEYLLKTEMNNVRFVQIDQGGVSNARNIALDMAEGKYVTFIDDDDYVSSMYLEELYVKASHDTISLCYPYAFDDGKPEIQLPYRITDAFDYCSKVGNLRLSSKVRKFFSGPCMKLIPMSFIQGRKFDVRFKNGEDSLFMFLISDKFEKVALTSKEAIYFRRYRENSAISKKRSRWNIVSNELKIMWQYTRIFFSSPFSYSFNFYITRLFGAVKSMFL